MEEEPKWRQVYRERQRLAAQKLAMDLEGMTKLRTIAKEISPSDAQKHATFNRLQLISFISANVGPDTSVNTVMNGNVHASGIGNLLARVNDNPMPNTLRFVGGVKRGDPGEDERAEPTDLEDITSTAWEKFRDFRKTLTKGKRFVADFQGQVSKAVSSIACIFDVSSERALKARNLPSISKIIVGRKQHPFRSKFAEQPSLGAGGTGFLVAPDLLLTAAHNLRKNGKLKDLADLRFVFGYHRSRNGQLPPNFGSNIYKLKDFTFGEEIHDDWALVELDKSVAGASCLTLSSRIDQPEGEPMYLIGHPLGLPLKISLIGNYIYPLMAHSFAISHDSFMGNSGSPLINVVDGTVEGLLVSGSQDFVLEKGEIRERVYDFDLLANGHAGERCQTISSIRPSIISTINAHLPV